MYTRSGNTFTDASSSREGQATRPGLPPPRQSAPGRPSRSDSSQYTAQAMRPSQPSKEKGEQLSMDRLGEERNVVVDAEGGDENVKQDWSRGGSLTVGRGGGRGGARGVLGGASGHSDGGRRDGGATRGRATTASLTEASGKALSGPGRRGRDLGLGRSQLHNTTLEHADRIAREMMPHKGGKPTTTRGQAIQAELDEIIEDMYGGTAPQRPPPSCTLPSPFSPSSTASGRRGRGGSSSAAYQVASLSDLPSVSRGGTGRQTGARKTGAGRGVGREAPTEDAHTLVGDEFHQDEKEAKAVYDAVIVPNEYSKSQIIFTGTLPSAWRRGGPVNPEGRYFDASDRNLLCMDVHGDYCVVGSADHGLKVFDITTAREKRKLFTKTSGHTEWVTACKFMSDGKRVLSGGMDSKLCLWHGTAPRCEDLLGHTGSVSHIEVNDRDMAISGSYDRSLRVWDCGGPAAPSARPVTRGCIGTLVGHKSPVTTFTWCGQNVTSGDRGGNIMFWDVESALFIATASTSRGQIGSLTDLLGPDVGHLCAMGDQGGVVSLYDFHRGGSCRGPATPVFQKVLHPGGVVSGLKHMPNSSLLVSCGADRVIQVLEERMGFTPLYTLTDHKDYIYSLEVFGPLILSGGGNGWLLAHDTTTGQCLYGLGANTAAVREIFASPEHLVAAGDDGKAMVYDFR